MSQAGERLYNSVRLITAVFVGLSSWLTSSAQSGMPSDPQIDTGIHSLGTYDGIHDKVSVMSGNLSFCIPLISLPGQYKHDLKIPLCFNSQFEEPNFDTTPPSLTPVVSVFPWVWGSKTAPLGPGWTLTGRPIVYTDNINGRIIFMPDGSKYTIPSSDGSGPDWDGGNLYMVPNWYLYEKDGTHVTAASDAVTGQELDSNLSQISYSPSSITDTVGRTVAVTAADASGAAPAFIAFSYPDSNGAQETVKLQVTTNTYSCSAEGDTTLNASYGVAGTYSLPSAILLPNGLSYTFQYDKCGNLAKITYPSGGYTRYEYTLEQLAVYGLDRQTNADDLHGYLANEVTAKYVCSAASGSTAATVGPGNTCATSEEKTTYTPTINGSAENNSSNTVTDPVGNYVTYSFSPAEPGPFPIPSLETSRQYYDKSGTLMKSVQTTYNGNGQNNAGLALPTLPQSETTTLDNGMVSQVQWTYDLRNFAEYDSPLLEKREYDYGPGAPGPMLRRTVYDWLHLDNPQWYGFPGPGEGGGGAHILDHLSSETVYDGTGTMVSQTTYQYDGGNPQKNGAAGNLTQVSRWRNTDGATLTTSYVWGVGGIISSTDPNMRTTSYSYADNYADGVNRNSNAFVTKITYPSTNGATHVEQKSYYYGSGLLAAACGQNFSGTCRPGLSSAADYISYAYDQLGRNVATTTGDGGASTSCFSEVSGASCFSNSYPLQINSAEVIAPGVMKTSIAELDGLGRTIRSQITSDPGCPVGGVKTDVTFDLDERPWTVSNPYCSVSDSTYGITTTIYDGLSRPVQVSHPDGSFVREKYTGRAVLLSDEGNGTRSVQRINQTDGLGRLASVCEVTGGSLSGLSGTPAGCSLDEPGTGFLTNYAYDALGDLVSVNQGGLGRSFTYDSLSRLSASNNPESGAISYLYDSDGNLTSKTDARGATTSFTYDALNRVTSKTYNDGVTPTSCFLYDQSATANGIGRLTTEWTQVGACATTPGSNAITPITERTFGSYDLMGRVTNDQQCAPPYNCGSGEPFAFNYSYDQAGDITNMNNGLTGSSQLKYTSQYDGAGHLCWLGDAQQSGECSSSGGLLGGTSYTPSGQLQAATLGEGISLNRTYNQRLWPVSETDTVAHTTGSAAVQIVGSEQINAFSSGSFTFTGTEQSMTVSGSTVYDTGNFQVMPFGAGEAPFIVTYRQNDTPQTMASKLATEITCSSTQNRVFAISSGAVVNLTSCASGTQTNYPLTVELVARNCSFAQASFGLNTSAAAMTPMLQVFNPKNQTGPLGTVSFGGQELSQVNGSSTKYQTGEFEFMIYPGDPASGSPVAVEQLSYGQGATPASLASALAADFPSCSVSGAIVNATVSGPTVSFTSCQSGTVYSEEIYLNVYDTSFAQPSFLGYADSLPDGPILSPAVYDEGTVTLTINGTAVSNTGFGAGDTPASIISKLVAAGNSNSLVNLAVSPSDPSIVTFTSKDEGAGGNYNYSLAIAADFPSPSFSAPSGSGTLGGGTNVPLYSWAINSYAPDGNILAVTDSVMGSWNYSYDDFNRLTSGSATTGSFSGLNLGWSYDRFGNRWTQTATGTGSAVQPSVSFTGNTNRVDGGRYDAAGNLLFDGINSYSYDGENRIVALNSQPAYVYDAGGNRVAKYSGGTISSVYLLGLSGAQVTEINGAGQWVHSNVFSDGKLLATYNAANTSYHYRLTDWLGTERMQTYASGNQEEVCTSYPFGDGLTCSGGQDATEHHFTGKERDTESGLDYFGARHYSSVTGRFFSPDWSAKQDPVPYADLRIPQSLDLYVYALNNPVAGADLDGHNPFTNWVQNVWNSATSALSNFFGGPASTSVTTTEIDSLPEPSQTTTAQVNPFGNSVLQAGGNYGIGSASVSYVPSTGGVFLTGGFGPPSDPGLFLGAGSTTNLNQSGFTAAVSGFYILGGGISGNPAARDFTTLFGIGTPGASAMTTGYTVAIGSLPAATFDVNLLAIPAMDATPISDGLYTDNECGAFGGTCN